MRPQWSRLIAGLAAVWLAGTTSPAEAQTRAQLIIGNNSYAQLPRLANAATDSTAIAVELRKSGFNVAELRDAGAGDMVNVANRFLKSIANGA